MRVIPQERVNNEQARNPNAHENLPQILQNSNNSTNSNGNFNKMQTSGIISNNTFTNTLLQAPKTTPDRLIFKFNIEQMEYDISKYNPQITNNKISWYKIRNLFQGLKNKDIIDKEFLMEDKGFCFYIFQLTMILQFWIFSVVCIFMYVKRNAKRKKDRLDERTEIFTEYQDSYNTENIQKTGWFWRVGTLSAWIELLRECSDEYNNDDNIFLPIAYEGGLNDISKKSIELQKNKILPLPEIPNNNLNTSAELQINYFHRIQEQDFYKPIKQRIKRRFNYLTKLNLKRVKTEDDFYLDKCYSKRITGSDLDSNVNNIFVRSKNKNSSNDISSFAVQSERELNITNKQFALLKKKHYISKSLRSVSSDKVIEKKEKEFNVEIIQVTLQDEYEDESDFDQE